MAGGQYLLCPAGAIHVVRGQRAGRPQQEGNFDTFSFNEWTDFSEREPGPECINGVSISLRLPRVILLMVYDRVPRKEVKFTRHNIFQRDKNTCQYCGKKFDTRDLNLDHVVPRQHNGPTTWENIVCSCIPCNTRKSNRTRSRPACT